MTKYIIFLSFKYNKNIYDLCNNFAKENINIINILKIKLNNTNNKLIINLLKTNKDKFIEYLKLNSVYHYLFARIRAPNIIFWLADHGFADLILFLTP